MWKFGTVSFLGIFASNLQCSVFAVQNIRIDDLEDESEEEKKISKENNTKTRSLGDLDFFGFLLRMSCHSFPGHQVSFITFCGHFGLTGVEVACGRHKKRL